MSKKNVTATFKSNLFNTDEVRDYFINPGCFGDDLGKWLMAKFDEFDVEYEHDGPDQEDFGWYVNFSLSNIDYTILIIYSEHDACWSLILEFNVGLIGSIFGKRNKPVGEEPIRLLSEILAVLIWLRRKLILT